MNNENMYALYPCNKLEKVSNNPTNKNSNALVIAISSHSDDSIEQHRTMAFPYICDAIKRTHHNLLEFRSGQTIT